MIVYASTKSEFRQDVRNNRIESLILQAYKRNLGHSTSESEIASWKNSMMYMSNILEDEGIPADTGVAIEYKIPQTSKRIDIILTGTNQDLQSTAVIVELKQWSDVKATNINGVVRTFINMGERETTHPSYQAWTYAALLEDFNEAVQTQKISLNPCAYLHNLESATVIRDDFYSECLLKAPVFIRSEAQKLSDFIKQFIRHGDSGKVMYEIDKGKIRPSKNLADRLLSMIQGNKEFIMIDDQKLAYEKALDLACRATVNDKHVLIVEGGPGTGKSVVAINLLVEITNRRLVTQYVTKNAAPRAVYESVLSGSYTRTHIANLFKGSGAYTETEANIFDALIVDEAHRLNEKSGIFQHLGENQVKEIIHASKCSIFFIDEDQRVTWKDIGTKEEIKNWARKLGATVHELELQSQFRCNGSNGYLAWLDNALGIKETANESLAGIAYDFKVFDSPNALRKAILEKNRINNKSRMVAGYCWDWVSKNPENKHLSDITFKDHDFAMQWNLQTDGSLWIRKPESVNQIGCIHTCQGLESDYIGVIIGPDLVVRDGVVLVQPEERAKSDQSLKGYRTDLRINPTATKQKVESIIKNTYRTLMTRGQKGCYLFCTDPETNAHFAQLASVIEADNATPVGPMTVQQDQDTVAREEYPGLGLRILDPVDVKPYVNSVPIFNLEVAAGVFGEEVYNVSDCEWVELPDAFRPQKDLFVTRVVGESMNRRIPNGSWCLFKSNPAGTRSGKIVIVQHRKIVDADSGCSFTIKLYRSEKVSDGEEWSHAKIILSPASLDPSYKEIIFDANSQCDLRVVGELVAIL
jgi:DUF2075 family protein/SOS-response transcriptional repressor LexA